MYRIFYNSHNNMAIIEQLHISISSSSIWARATFFLIHHYTRTCIYIILKKKFKYESLECLESFQGTI